MGDFRLQKILDVKMKLLDAKEKELGSARRLLDDVTAEIAAVEDEARRRYHKTMAQVVDGSDFSVFRDYLQFLDTRKIELKAKRVETEKVLEILKREVVELLTEIKTLEILKSRAMSAEKKARNRREQKHLDSMALKKKT